MATKETVRIRTKAGKTKLSDPTEPGAWIDAPGSTVVPRVGTDDEKRGEIILSGFMVRTPASAVVGDTDEIEIRGRIHQIDGSVADYGRKGKLFYTTRVN